MMTCKIRQSAGLAVMLTVVMMFCCYQEASARRNVVAVPKSEVRTVPIAHNLVVEAPFLVELTAGMEPGRVEIESDSLFLPYIETVVDNFTLVIRVSNAKPKRVTQAVPVRVRLNHDWLSIVASKGAEIRSEEVIQAADMTISLSGAQLRANLMCMNLKMECTGHSLFDGNVEATFVDLTLEQQSEFHAFGMIEKMLAYCTTGSRIDMLKAACNHFYLECYQQSEVRAQVLENLNVKAHGDCSVVYAGGCSVALSPDTPAEVVSPYK